MIKNLLSLSHAINKSSLLFLNLTFQNIYLIYQVKVMKTNESRQTFDNSRDKERQRLYNVILYSSRRY